MHERMHARRMDVDTHFGHPDISFLKDKCRIEDIGQQNGSKHAFKWDLKAKWTKPWAKGVLGHSGFIGPPAFCLSATFCYTILSERGPQRMDFGAR